MKTIISQAVMLIAAVKAVSLPMENNRGLLAQIEADTGIEDYDSTCDVGEQLSAHVNRGA